MKRFILGTALIGLVLAVGTVLTLRLSQGEVKAQAARDPLPSWNDGPAKKAILDFVRVTTDKDSPKFVPPAERIATFDQDGTLWVEHPMYTQVVYCLDRVPAVVAKKPELKDVEPFKTVLSGDREAIAKMPMKDLEEILFATLTGMPIEEFQAEVKKWLATARHPRYKRPYTELVYQPMLEVLKYLRANGYKTYIVTGGGQDFVRVYAERVYGIPREQVVGTMGGTKYGYDKDGKPMLVKEPKLLLNDNNAGKPEGIHLMIGRRPVAAFGNSTGDRQMLEYTKAGSGARLAMLLLHDDAKTEYAYGPAQGLPDTKVGTFTQELYDEAEKGGWVVISMKKDWARVFPFDPETAPTPRDEKISETPGEAAPRPTEAVVVNESAETVAADFKKDARAALKKYKPVMAAPGAGGGGTVQAYGEVAYEPAGSSLQMTRKDWTVHFKGPVTGKGKYARIQVEYVAVGPGIVVLEGKIERGEKPFKPAPATAAEADAVTAIDILLEPDATMVKHAVAANERLLKVFPKGFALGKTHRPHISCLQRYVKTADLDKVYEAVGKVLADENPTAWKLKAYRYDYVVWDRLGVTVILIEPSDDLTRYQKKLIDAVAPFTVKTGTAAAFVTTKEAPDINKPTIDYVTTYVPDGSGKNFKPHVTVGVAPPDDLKKMLDEKFESFTFSPVGVSVYHLGNFGTARKKLKGWEFKP